MGGRKSRQKGKRVEREIAKDLGVNRNPADGLSHTDIYWPPWAIESKARDSLPKWLHDAMAQAVADLKGDRKWPVVILTESSIGQKPVQYAVLRYEDWKQVKFDD